MNGYDFDKTIFNGNCFRRFWYYCLLRLPYLLLLAPIQLLAVVLRALRIINKDTFLWMLGWFVALVPNKQRFVTKFWDKNFARMQPWYLAQRKDDDVIISASPAYIVQEACRRLGVKCIASNVNPKTATVTGTHCYGQGKIWHYTQQFGDTSLMTYYSDSWSDTPMFKMVQRGYLVKGSNVMLVYKDGQPVIY